MSAIEMRRVDPVSDRARVPLGWVAYRSTKTVFEMLAEEVECVMRTTGLNRRQAEDELLRRAVASLES